MDFFLPSRSDTCPYSKWWKHRESRYFLESSRIVKILIPHSEPISLSI
jgi:hypothetical protein